MILLFTCLVRNCTGLVSQTTCKNFTVKDPNSWNTKQNQFMTYEWEKKWAMHAKTSRVLSKKKNPKDSKATIIQKTDFVWSGNDPHYLEARLK